MVRHNRKRTKFLLDTIPKYKSIKYHKSQNNMIHISLIIPHNMHSPFKIFTDKFVVGGKSIIISSLHCLGSLVEAHTYGSSLPPFSQQKHLYLPDSQQYTDSPSFHLWQCCKYRHHNPNVEI